MPKLPDAFLQRMKELLGTNYPEFLNTFEKERYYGLRVNTLKIEPETLKEMVPFQLRPIPWAKEGFYYEESDEPGKHPYHSAGLYYIQEPSAMAPGTILDVQPGERVLDLCAAPGGKTTQIGARLQGEGVVVANDISFSRAQVLAMNLERLGVKNSFVTNERPERLAQYFPAYFDKILVDAPCSGEGMFRKMPEAVNHWSQDAICQCQGMQKEILNDAVKMLKVGGSIVYSTCTFAPEENEGSIETFLRAHPEFRLKEIHRFPGFQPGQPQWIEQGRDDLRKTIRLWPQHLAGEGHFVALLEKIEGKDGAVENYLSNLSPQDLQDFEAFCQESLLQKPQGEFTLFGSHLYLTPSIIPPFSGLKVVRPGWYLGEMKKNRFKPAHGLAMGLKPSQVVRTISLESETEITAYLRGETLRKEGEKGWTLIEIDGFSLGWAKWVNGIVKNHYPRSMRWFF